MVIIDLRVKIFFFSHMPLVLHTPDQERLMREVSDALGKDFHLTPNDRIRELFEQISLPSPTDKDLVEIRQDGGFDPHKVLADCARQWKICPALNPECHKNSRYSGRYYCAFCESCEYCDLLNCVNAVWCEKCEWYEARNIIVRYADEYDRWQTVSRLECKNCKHHVLM